MAADFREKEKSCFAGLNISGDPVVYELYTFFDKYFVE